MSTEFKAPQTSYIPSLISPFYKSFMEYSRYKSEQVLTYVFGVKVIIHSYLFPLLDVPESEDTAAESESRAMEVAVSGVWVESVVGLEKLSLCCVFLKAFMSVQSS